MNANELADGIESCTTDLLHYKAAAMLRQQAKELDEAGHMIGVLREQLQEEIQARADALDDLNSRMMKFMKSYNEMAYKLEEVGGAYTHPVKELDEQYEKGFKAGKEEGWKAHKFHHPVKELTDEEMLEICQRIGVDYGSWYIHEFARAILRKAQEK